MGSLWELYFVDDLEVRKRLAAQIANKDLEGRAARDAIAREAKKVQHGGRPAQPDALRVLLQIHDLVAAAKKARDFAPDAMRKMDAAQRRKTRSLIAELRRTADEVERALGV